jgi:deoxyribodipyrimidine photo-lyase
LKQVKDSRSVIEFKGGEDAALRRLDSYLKSGALMSYKETRNGLLGADASSKLSPWFAQGSLSVR